jgi:hypothetical protein
VNDEGEDPDSDIEVVNAIDLINDYTIRTFELADAPDRQVVLGTLSDPATVTRGIDQERVSDAILSGVVRASVEMCEEGCPGSGDIAAHFVRAGYALGRHWIGDLDTTVDWPDLTEDEVATLGDEVAADILEAAFGDDSVYAYLPIEFATIADDLTDTLLAGYETTLQRLPDPEVAGVLVSCLENGVLTFAADWTVMHQDHEASSLGWPPAG